MNFNPLNIARSLINPMTVLQLAAGPAGWASLAARTIASAVGQQVIQNLGEKLGLPQSVIDGAQAAFCAATGDKAGAVRNAREAQTALTEAFDLSPRQSGEVERDINNIVGDLAARLSESEDFKAAKNGGKGGGSWLMALASALGDKLNVKAAQVQSLANSITDKSPKSTALFGAATQEFGILMNATNNAIKTLGESLTTTARKG